MNARHPFRDAHLHPAQLLALSAALTLALSACSSSDGNGDGDGSATGENIFTGSCPEGVDPSVNTDTAIALEPGTETEDYICPQRDKDFYKITVPADRNLLQMNLQHSNPLSRVDLIYLIVKAGATAEENVVVASSPGGKNNRFDALHCLEPGTYFIQVQDGNDDAVDDTSTYRLSYTLDADQDTNERNNTVDTATDITAPLSGRISCTEDADYYRVQSVGANQLVRLRLTTTEPTAVDYRVSLLQKVGDNTVPLLTRQNDDGTREPTAIETIASVPSGGDYYIKVEDVDNNDSDAAKPYQLSVEKLAELDANESSGPRNDHPNDPTNNLIATKLGDFTGSAVTFAKSGRIGYDGDVDYFLIGDTRSGGGKANIEIELTMPTGIDVDPSVALIYPTDTACTKDKCCNVIDLPVGRNCSNPLSCDSSSFVCQDQGQAFCADPECAGEAVTSTCASTRRCAGAVLCLKQGSAASGVCGAIQFFRPTFQEVQNGGELRTGHPLKHAGPWYLRVADQGGDEFDYDSTYQLEVKVSPEPDAFEYDNGYFPRLINSADREPVVSAEGIDSLNSYFSRESTRQNLGDVMPRPTAATPTVDWGNAGIKPIRGHISYENDVDYYRFNNPCHNNPDVDRGMCMIQARYRATGGGCPSAPDGPGSGLEFKFIITSRDNGAEIPAGLPSPSTSWRTFGYPDGQGCQIMTRFINAGSYGTASTGPTFDMQVFDAFRNNYSSSCGYEIQFRVAFVGCAAPPCKFDQNWAAGAPVDSCYP